MTSYSSSAVSKTTGRPWPIGGTPPIGKPVAARTSSLDAIRPSAQSSASQTLSESMRWRPEATTMIGSPSITNRIDFAIWPSSTPSAAAACATVAVEFSSVFSSMSSPSSRAASLTLERMSRPCRRRRRAYPYVREGNAGGVGKLLQRFGEVSRDVFQVGHRVVVADHAEVERAVVAHRADPEPLVHGQRNHREDVEQLLAMDVERELRPGNIGHNQV